MSSLTTYSKLTKSGKVDSLVIFLHGFGADGKDLLGLANSFSEHLPNTVFLAPDAPNKCSSNPMGYEWFPIPWIDGSSEEAAKDGMADALIKLNLWLDEVAVEYNISAKRTVLVGFSQGTMMCLHCAPRRLDVFAGVVGLSGRLLSPETLADDVISKPPILLIHGDQDDVVPYSDLADTARVLNDIKFKVYTHTSKGTGHGIAEDGLVATLKFIKEVL